MRLRSLRYLALTVALAFYSLNSNAGLKGLMVDLQLATVGGVYTLKKVDKSLNNMEFQLVTIRDAADCSGEVTALEDNLRRVRELRAVVQDDIRKGVDQWHNRENAEKFDRVYNLEAEISYPDNLQALVKQCAKSRGYGLDVMALKGAIKWTKDRIKEYAEYLPRVSCNTEVYDWMKANDAEAKRVLPKLQAAYDSGIKKYYEYSPYTRPMYLEYKNLEAMHQDVYKNEAKVFRGAAKECAKTSVEVQIDDISSAIDALDGVTQVHSEEWYKRLVEAAETRNRKK